MKIAASIILGVVIAVSIGSGALALLARAESGDFTSGTVRISAAPSGALFTVHEATPGDALTGTITVTNEGSLELRYALTSDAIGDTTAGQMTVTVWDEAEEHDADSPCKPEPPAVVLYSPARLGAAEMQVIGDSAQGAQAGDRTLAAGASETLCFRANLPLSARVTLPGFHFEAEQTERNGNSNLGPLPRIS